MSRFSTSLGWCLMAFSVACSAGTTDGTGAGPGAGGAGGSGAGGPGPGGNGTGNEGGGFITTGGGGEGAGLPEIAEVFGHSASELYRLDPDTKAVTMVGAFDGCDGVIDIALDKDSRIVGTTFDGIYQIDKATAACTLITSGSYPNSLSFIPAGTLDPNVEALVGYIDDEYVRIDPQSGSVTTIGYLGAGSLISSGDIVSVKDGATFLTVKGSSCPTDCLMEVNPSTGGVVKNWGPLGYSNAFGIAFWAGSVYGFTSGGALFEVTFDNNVMATTLIAQPGTQFWGAGSTTSAPPIPVPD